MPFRPRRKQAPRRRPAMNRQLAVRRPLRSPQPIFTETFRLKFGQPPLNPGYNMASNSGGTLSVNIGDVPQITNYSSLYTKYRILKATFICLPQFVSQSADINGAAYNQSLGLGAWGQARVITALQTSPDGGANPASEEDVLQHNNCQIHSGKSKLVLSCRPVPDLLDANGNRVTARAPQFLNFENNVDGEIEHYGIKWWYTLPNLSPLVDTNVPIFVYCKLTFQLADSR